VMNKKELRMEIKEKLQYISNEVYTHQSMRIARALFKDDLWESAHTIGITISKPPEVDTYQIIRKAWDEGKKIVIPKCFPKERRMDFRSLEHFDQLESVYYHLLEPIESKTTKVDSKEIDLLIVPGLAFSKDGYRLGFGGGYYDRFLESYQGNTLSIAFQQQIVSDVPKENHDLPVMKIITDERSYTAS